MSQLEGIKAERECFLSYSAFHSLQAFKALEEAHSHQGRQSALLCLLIQVLITLRNTLTETSRNNV